MTAARPQLAALAAFTLALASCTTTTPAPPAEIVQVTRDGASIDCNGELYRKGREVEIQIKGPISTSIRRCTINGSIRTMGMARTGEGRKLRASSRRPGHTARAQDAAPRDVLIEDVTLNPTRRTPLYIGPGTTRLTLRNSTLAGTSNLSAIYADAESAGHVITGNTIKTERLTGREAIAIDGTAGTTITKNRINGQAKLYRNCGEGGTIRHQTPSDNIITRNTFTDLGDRVPVAVNARDSEPDRSYCDDDSGYPFGSSADDRDGGKDNTIQPNKVLP